MEVRKAVIVAGGWGTRFLPITKSQPKEMLPLVNKPIIQYSVEEAIACGVDLVIIVTAQGKRAIEDHFDRSIDLEFFLHQKGELQLVHEVRRLSDMVDICYVRQKQQLGLGHAVLSTKNVVGDEPFILLLPDDIFEYRELVLQRMLQVYSRYQESVIAAKQVTEEQVSRYGIIKPRRITERVYEVADLVEKPTVWEAPSNLAVMGRYVLTPEIFKLLENTPPGRHQEIQLTDALQQLLQWQSVYAYEFEGEHYDAGTLSGWLKTMITLALKDPDIGPDLRAYLNGHFQSAQHAEEVFGLKR